MKKRFYIIVLMLWASAGMTKAQAPVIVTPYPQPAQQLIRTYDSTYLYVQVNYTSTGGCANATVNIKFPSSVTYIPGSVEAITTGSPSTTPGFSIADGNISNLRSPVFNVNAPAAGTLYFRLKRQAGCGGTGTGKDTVVVSGACGTVTENDPDLNAYNFRAPALSLIAPSAISGAVIGQNATRTFTVTNGGSGSRVDTVRLYIVYPLAGIINTNSNKITVGSTDFAPWRTNGDTLFYKVYGPVFPTNTDANTTLDNGETVTIVEPIRITKCNTTTSYAAYWSNAVWPACQTASGTSTVTMASGVPNFSIAPVTNATYTTQCNTVNLSATFTNSGNGDSFAATMYNVKIRIEGYTGFSWGGGNQSTFSDFNINGNAVSFSGSNTTTDTINIANAFATDPDGAGVGLDDIDGDGFYDDLAPGKTVSLSWKMMLYCNNACGTDRTLHMSYRMIYKNMCGTDLISVNLGIYYPVNETGFGTTSYVPANISGGTPFRFLFNTSFFSNVNHYFGVNGRYQWRLVMPAGMSVAPVANARYGNTTVTYSTAPGPTGDTLIITSPNNVLDSAAINLVYSCGNGGPLNLWHSLLKISDLSAGCYCSSSKFCATIRTFVVCPGPCPTGPTTYMPNIRRVDNCLGWTNATLTTRQSASNIGLYDLSKALYLDTIQISSGAKQNNAATNIHLMLELPKTTISPTGVNKLTPVDVSAQIWRGGTQILTCNITSFDDSSTAAMQRVAWNLCVPTGGLLPGDSIFSISRYVVATNAGLPTYDVQSGNDWYYYNISNTGTKDYCTHWVPEMYLVGTGEQIGTNGTNATGCTSFIPGSGFAYFARRFATNGQIYRSEFRPMVYIDSIVFTKSTGYNFVSATLTRNATTFASAATLNITPNYVIGNSYTFINPGTWPFMGITKTNEYGGNFMPTVSTNCATTATEYFNTKVYIKDYYYAFGSPSAVPATYQYVMPGMYTNANIAGVPAGWVYPLNYATSTKPTLFVQNTTGAVQGVQTNQYWDVKVSNTSTTGAGYVWLALEKGTGSGLINVASVIDLATNATLTSEGSYSCAGTTGLKWYKFNTAGIASGAEANFRINFTYSSCSADSILFKAGWACDGYPVTDPCSYPCTASQAYLKVIPNSSQVQMAIVRQPGGGSSTSMCATDSVTFTINSAQAANLVEPYVTIYPPTGVNITTPIPVEYPLNSGAWYNVTPTAIPGGYRVDLTTIPGISNNVLPGTATDPAVSPRQAKFKVAYTTTCEVVSGTSFKFYGFGKMPCGAPAIENGTAVQSGGVSITGATASGNAGLSLSLPVTSLDCGQSTTLNLSTTVVGTPTQVGDTVIYTLPVGVGYAGNFSGVSNCSNCTVTVVPDAAGNTIVKIKLDAGVSVNSVIGYKFDITATGGGSCGNVSIGGAAKRIISGLSCGATACTSSAMIVGTGTSDPITINKPAPVLNSFSVASGAWQPTSTVNLAVTVTNMGTVNMAASSYYVEFFCGNSTTPMAVNLFPSAVAIGSTVTANMSITVNSNCPGGSLITAKIRPMSVLGSQCICGETSYTYSVALPVVLESFNASAVSNCEVVLTWKASSEENFDHYEVEYSTDGLSFAAIGNVVSNGMRNYRFTHNPPSGKGYYRLKFVDRDGRKSYSDIVTAISTCKGIYVSAYPNPVNDKLTVMLSGSDKPVACKLLNSIGQLIISKVLLNGRNELNTSNLSSGIYHLVVEGNDMERRVFKINVKH